MRAGDAVVVSAHRDGPVVTLRARYDDGREIVSAHTGLAPPAPGTRVAVEISREAVVEVPTADGVSLRSGDALLVVVSSRRPIRRRRRRRAPARARRRAPMPARRRPRPHSRPAPFVAACRGAASAERYRRAHGRCRRVGGSQRSPAHLRSPAMIWSKTAVTDAAEARSAAVRPGPSHWITGVTPGPHDRDAVLLARAPAGASPGSDSRGTASAARSCGRTCRSACGRGSPTSRRQPDAVDRVEGVDVDVAAVAVLRVALSGRAEAVDRAAGVGEAAEQPLPGAAVRPVRVHLELRELAAPVREVELVGGLRGHPWVEAEQRQPALPRLHRPVGPVRRLARGDEVRERRPVVGRAAVLERRPVRARSGTCPSRRRSRT